MEQEPRTARERAVLLLRATLLPGWRSTASQGLVWAIRGAILLGVIALVASAVDKTLWDWLELLIVPAALAIGVAWINRAQQERERKAEEARRDRELEVESQRAQDEALQAYLDQMGQLLLDKDRPLRRSKEDSEVRTLARAWTLAVLSRLDGDRRGTVVQFLYESGLIDKDSGVVDLTRAVLARAILTQANLKGANLLGAHLARANLVDANLSEADLSDARLFGADLSRAELNGANLSAAVLMGDERSNPLPRASL